MICENKLKDTDRCFTAEKDQGIFVCQAAKISAVTDDEDKQTV